MKIVLNSKKKLLAKISKAIREIGVSPLHSWIELSVIHRFIIKHRPYYTGCVIYINIVRIVQVTMTNVRTIQVIETMSVLYRLFLLMKNKWNWCFNEWIAVSGMKRMLLTRLATLLTWAWLNESHWKLEMNSRGQSSGWPLLAHWSISCPSLWLGARLWRFRDCCLLLALDYGLLKPVMNVWDRYSSSF